MENNTNTILGQDYLPEFYKKIYKDIYREICKKKIRQDWRFIKCIQIDCLDKEDYKEVIRQSWKSINYIKHEHLTDDLLNIAIKEYLCKHINEELLGSIKIVSKEQFIKVIDTNGSTKYVRGKLNVKDYIYTIYDNIETISSIDEVTETNKYYLLQTNNIYDIYILEKVVEVKNGWFSKYNVDTYNVVKLCSCEQFVFI